MPAVAEHHREVAVIEADAPGRARALPLVGGALDHRAEADARPVILEDVAEKGLQESLLQRQRPDLAGRRAVLAALRLARLRRDTPALVFFHVMAPLSLGTSRTCRISDRCPEPAGTPPASLSNVARDRMLGLDAQRHRRRAMAPASPDIAPRRGRDGRGCGQAPH